MKKLFLILSFFAFLGMATSARAVCPCQQSAQTVGIFSDPGFSQSTHNFSPGQIVYARVETPGGGENKNELRILDSGKKTIRILPMARTGTGPYVFTASFSAPEAEGIYYLDIKIEGGGSSFASQRNINVGEGSSIAAVSSTAKSVVGQGDQRLVVPTVSLSPSLVSPTSTPTKPDVMIQRANFFLSQLGEIFRRIFSYLTTALK